MIKDLKKKLKMELKKELKEEVKKEALRIVQSIGSIILGIIMIICSMAILYSTPNDLDGILLFHVVSSYIFWSLSGLVILFLGWWRLNK